MGSLRFYVVDVTIMPVRIIQLEVGDILASFRDWNVSIATLQ